MLPCEEDCNVSYPEVMKGKDMIEIVLDINKGKIIVTIGRESVIMCRSDS